MTRNVELSEFLRRSRARITPESAGLPERGAYRRVPGLRREEVAQLAGVSTDYYTRLEQGRQISPSAGVLESVAAALRLDAAERAHLIDPSPARPAAPHRPCSASGQGCGGSWTPSPTRSDSSWGTAPTCLPPTTWPAR
ncbi:helix-turn-helix domain-containing protein [Streptomyces sp. NBC_01637]|uniref:helix-turn-helix domain-containing protein n=1 Tax=unclassified Streptomyces TaxID=2593676 RepID=UPI0038681459|nr:helix-turn-helix domain-containing protein [Streptomyces sp. NBC_01653]WTC84615.1 helix-turn-helix domain-containing protein [Streptomyces sp. NBC_01653]WTD86252.1 helix-turn-helix domain-containing protein [Streptomyces sp. NBC_01637]WTD94272.1 helix-turn-helix domain-containing protein [Streptomyces sp. NBC_01637]